MNDLFIIQSSLCLRLAVTIQSSSVVCPANPLQPASLTSAYPVGGQGGRGVRSGRKLISLRRPALFEVRPGRGKLTASKSHRPCTARKAATDGILNELGLTDIWWATRNTTERAAFVSYLSRSTYIHRLQMGALEQCTSTNNETRRRKENHNEMMDHHV